MSPTCDTNTEHAENRTRPSLAWQGAWVVIARIASIASALVVNAILARMLDPAEFGLFFLFNSILTCASLGAMFGLNTALIRFVSEAVSQRRIHAARHALRMGLKVAIVSITLGGLITAGLLWAVGESLFGFAQPQQIAWLMLANVLVLAVLQLIACCLRAFHESLLSTLLTGQLGGVVCNVPFVVLLIAGHSAGTTTLVWALTINSFAMLLAVPFAAVYLIRLAKQQLPASASHDEPASATSMSLWAMLAICTPLAASQLLSFVLGHGDLWVAGAFVSHDDLALYGAGRRIMLLVGLPMQMVNLTVVSSIAILYAHGSIEELNRKLRTAATIAAVPSLLMMIVLLAIPGQVTRLLFGPFYQDAALVLMILTVGQIVHVCAGPGELTLMMTGRQYIALWINIAAAASLLLVGPLVTERLGIVGLAVFYAMLVALQNIAFCVATYGFVGVRTMVDWRLLHALPQRLALLRARLA